MNELLDKVQSNPGKTERVKIFMQINQDFSAKEQMWLARMILGDMKMGVKHESLLKHLDMEHGLDLYSSCCNLRKVCSAEIKILTQSIRIRTGISHSCVSIQPHHHLHMLGSRVKSGPN